MVLDKGTIEANLVNFAEHHRLVIGNTLFQKKENRKWTWISPNATTKNEIDFILSNKKRIIKDVSVINRFNTGNDHRLVRGTIQINTKYERAILAKKKLLPVTAHIKYKNEEFRMLLTNRFAPLANLTEDTATNVTDINDRIVSIFIDTAKEVTGTVRKPKVDKLSSTTRQLMERRRQMKRDGIPAQRIEYSEICKLIRRKMKEDICNYNVKEIEEAIDKNTSLKRRFRRQILGRQEIFILKETDGTIITNRDRLTRRTEEFMTALQQQSPTNWTTAYAKAE